MDVKKISEKGNKIKILVSGADVSFVNGIRRTIMNSVPTMAIENVTLLDNSSVMFDEMLSHRLGMLPIKTDLKTYKMGEKVKMVLEKEGPATVYSKDIQSTEPSIEVIDKKVPIVKLADKQKVKLELEAVVGTGKTHSKWQPALVSFNEVYDVSVNIKDPKEQKNFLSNFPQGMFEVKAGKIVLADPVNSNPDLVDYAAELSGTQAEHSGTSFVISLENFGQLETDEIFLEAVKILEEKVKEFKEELKKI